MPSSSSDDIKTAYRRMCLKLHPDINREVCSVGVPQLSSHALLGACMNKKRTWLRARMTPIDAWIAPSILHVHAYIPDVTACACWSAQPHAA